MNLTENVEGTIVLDGLIEGRLDDLPALAGKLEMWVQFMGQLGLRFTLDMSGSAFSILPENQPVSTAKLGGVPEEAIRQGVEQLVEVAPPEESQKVFSTLRSVETRKGEQVQAMYGVTPAGKVEVRTRTVEAQTVAPPEPIPTKERVKLAMFGLLAAIAIIGIAMLIPPVRGKVVGLFSTMESVDKEDLTVSATPFQKYFTVEKKEVISSRTLVAVVKRTEAFPTSAAQLETAYTEATTLHEKLAVEAIARGYVRIELIDSDGKPYGTFEMRIRDLAAKEEIEMHIPLRLGDKKQRVQFVEFRY